MICSAPTSPMRIGIVSDTHNHLRNVHRIVDLFAKAEVERVVHTGDITQAKTLEPFASLAAPFHGVYGNNDLERESLESAATRLGLRLSEPPLHLEWANRRIVVVHDPRDLTDERLAASDVALHGHDHRRTFEQRHGAWVMNPGECAGHVPGLNAVGVLDLVSLESEILEF
jgi:putative phosphoesterase